MRIMALDVGKKRIGLAMSDQSCTIAQGVGTVERIPEKQAICDIARRIERSDVEKLVVGLPLNMDGSRGERASDCQKFAQELRNKIGIPVIMWDERLTSRQAEGIMLEADISRKKRKKNIDKLAAQLILQNYLDFRKEKGQGL